jgi:cellulose biosynthesis protein BcsQ
MPVEFIGLWTNKGGVGKTTLTFHLASAYAVLNPTKRVVVIDMCPQVCPQAYRLAQ